MRAWCQGKFVKRVDAVLDGNDTNHLHAAIFYKCRQFAGASQCIAEPRYHQFVATLQTRYELLPHRAQPLVFGQFLYHLYTAVLLHPGLVFCILFAIGGDEDVTYFCHTVVRY